jgi:hypothetical protein
MKKNLPPKPKRCQKCKKETKFRDLIWHKKIWACSECVLGPLEALRADDFLEYRLYYPMDAN